MYLSVLHVCEASLRDFHGTQRLPRIRMRLAPFSTQSRFLKASCVLCDRRNSRVVGLDSAILNIGCYKTPWWLRNERGVFQKSLAAEISPRLGV